MDEDEGDILFLRTDVNSRPSAHDKLHVVPRIIRSL